MRILNYATMAFVIALFVSTARADDVKMGVGVVCDTSEQVIAFYTDFDGNLKGRLEKINANAPRACAFLHIAYKDGVEVGKLDAVDGIIRILKVTVVGSMFGGQWAKVEPEDTQYIAVFEKAQGV